MDLNSTEAKKYEEKVSAQLQQVKSQLDQLEARAKEKKAQAEIETINTLKTVKQQIDKKRQDLQTSVGAKAAQTKAEIDAELAKLKSSLGQLTMKLKDQAARKAS